MKHSAGKCTCSRTAIIASQKRLKVLKMNSLWTPTHAADSMMPAILEGFGVTGVRVRVCKRKREREGETRWVRPAFSRMLAVVTWSSPENQDQNQDSRRPETTGRRWKPKPTHVGCFLSRELLNLSEFLCLSAML